LARNAGPPEHRRRRTIEPPPFARNIGLSARGKGHGVGQVNLWWGIIGACRASRQGHGARQQTGKTTAHVISFSHCQPPGVPAPHRATTHRQARAPTGSTATKAYPPPPPCISSQMEPPR
jgi:hypothetical protein